MARYSKKLEKHSTLKYKNKITEVDGIKFRSKAEARRYGELKLLRRAKEVKYFLMQVPFHLPGGVKYVCDFYVVWTDGKVTVEDVKGVQTPTFIMKRKMVEDLYPISITLIRYGKRRLQRER